MKIIMELSSNNEFFDGVAQGATVELTPEDIITLKNLSSFCRDLDLYKVVRFNNPLEFFVIDWETDERVEFEGRVECVTLNVTEYDVFWSGYYKHTDVRWETTTVPLRDLEIGADLDYTECEQY